MSGRCRRLLVEAAALAAERKPVAIVLTGGRGGEAEQMRAAWPGRTDVELLVEPTAAITAENASRSLPLLLERGVTEATIVCAPLHLPRVRYLFGGVYGRAGISTRFRAARAMPTPPALAWELGAALVARRQRRAAEAELDA
jgi:uncharacterized SAM-binding protein YcdF (DUF218 family)